MEILKVCPERDQLVPILLSGYKRSQPPSYWGPCCHLEMASLKSLTIVEIHAQLITNDSRKIIALSIAYIRIEVEPITIKINIYPNPNLTIKTEN